MMNLLLCVEYPEIVRDGKLTRTDKPPSGLRSAVMEAQRAKVAAPQSITEVIPLGTQQLQQPRRRSRAGPDVSAVSTSSPAPEDRHRCGARAVQGGTVQ
jgi:hypothetical protein